MLTARGSNGWLCDQVASTLWVANSDKETQTKQFLAAATAMIGAKPADELEGMLIAQIVAAHSGAMECYRRAMLPDQTFVGRETSLKYSAKLSRTYADLVLALDKHRGKEQQRVTVEHVHVHQGGQAIVGNVQGGGVPAAVQKSRILQYAASEALAGILSIPPQSAPLLYDRVRTCQKRSSTVHFSPTVMPIPARQGGSTAVLSGSALTASLSVASRRRAPFLRCSGRSFVPDMISTPEPRLQQRRLPPLMTLPPLSFSPRFTRRGAKMSMRRFGSSNGVILTAR
jgi:hypothetical protein